MLYQVVKKIPIFPKLQTIADTIASAKLTKKILTSIFRPGFKHNNLFRFLLFPSPILIILNGFGTLKSNDTVVPLLFTRTNRREEETFSTS